MQKVLLIDKNVDICNMLSAFLKKKGYEVEVAHNGIKGLKALKDESINVVLTEIRLSDFPGVEIIKEIKKIRSQIQVIVVSSYADVKIAVKAMRTGAYEYVTKPILPEEIVMSLNGAIKRLENLETDIKKKKGKSKEPSDKYVKGKGSRADKINTLIKLVGPTNMSTLIIGESGTGKEVVARQIHMASKRKDKPFVAVDCGAIPEELAGSELFGFMKGAFTGAMIDKAGYFEQAKGGTLFLDEIGNLSYENQVKLLRVLQERKVRRIGGLKDISVNVRIIAATNEDLKEKVNKGEFREDIYFRINEFKIELPALRERGKDLDLFLKHFLKLANKELNKEIKGFEEDVLEKFKEYAWYGNIRELKNVIKRATLLEQGKKISLQSIPEEIIYPVLNQDDYGIDIERELTTLKDISEAAEKKAILNALKKSNFNKSKCAKLLEVDRKTLYNKMSQYEIEV